MGFCSAVTLAFATIFSLAAVALLAIAFSTDNWLTIHVNLRGKDLQVEINLTESNLEVNEFLEFVLNSFDFDFKSSHRIPSKLTQRANFPSFAITCWPGLRLLADTAGQTNTVKPHSSESTHPVTVLAKFKQVFEIYSCLPSFATTWLLVGRYCLPG